MSPFYHYALLFFISFSQFSLFQAFSQSNSSPLNQSINISSSSSYPSSFSPIIQAPVMLRSSSDCLDTKQFAKTLVIIASYGYREAGDIDGNVVLRLADIDVEHESKYAQIVIVPSGDYFIYDIGDLLQPNGKIFVISGRTPYLYNSYISMSEKFNVSYRYGLDCEVLIARWERTGGVTNITKGATFSGFSISATTPRTPVIPLLKSNSFRCKRIIGAEQVSSFGQPYIRGRAFECRS